MDEIIVVLLIAFGIIVIGVLNLSMSAIRTKFWHIQTALDHIANSNRHDYEYLTRKICNTENMLECLLEEKIE